MTRIRLKPDYADAFINRGATNTTPSPTMTRRSASNRTTPKTTTGALQTLGRYDGALADYDETIRLKPDYADAFINRGIAKTVLGLKDEARKDFETGLESARNANNPNIVRRAEQSLRDLDDGA